MDICGAIPQILLPALPGWDPDKTSLVISEVGRR